MAAGGATAAGVVTAGLAVGAAVGALGTGAAVALVLFAWPTITVQLRQITGKLDRINRGTQELSRSLHTILFRLVAVVVPE